MHSATGICFRHLDGISVMRSSFELEKKMGSGTIQVAHKTEPPIAFVCSLIKFLFYAWLCIILNHNFLGHK